jgi:hypothetical protein
MTNTAEELFSMAMDAAYAMEDAARRYGPTSHEACLAKAAYDLHMADYRDATGYGKECHCDAPCVCQWQGNKQYDC